MDWRDLLLLFAALTGGRAFYNTRVIVGWMKESGLGPFSRQTGKRP
jgi:hypothetical protein